MPEGGEPTSPAEGGRFGLSAQDTDTLEQVLGTVMTGMGLDGPAIARAMRRGERLVDALNLPPQTVEALYARAHATFIAGQHADAEKLFRTLTLFDGRVVDHWLGLGICMRMRDEMKLAREAFEIASAVAPDSPVPHFHLLEICMVLGDLPAARAARAAIDKREGAGLTREMKLEISRLDGALSARTKNGAAKGKAAS